MTHFAAPEYWRRYNALPESVRKQADRSFELVKSNPRHPSLHLKQAGRFRSVRVGLHHRAVAVEVPDGLLWFWVGTHAEYDRLIRT